MQAGEIHNKGQVQKDAEAIEQGYLDSGYIDAVVTPQITLDRERKLRLLCITCRRVI